MRQFVIIAWKEANFFNLTSAIFATAQSSHHGAEGIRICIVRLMKGLFCLPSHRELVSVNRLFAIVLLPTKSICKNSRFELRSEPNPQITANEIAAVQLS